MAGRWRLAEGMSLTHLENGGWAVSDLRRLSVYELNEDTGTLLDQVLRGGTVPVDLPVLQEALTSGILVEVGSNGAAQTERIGSES